MRFYLQARGASSARAMILVGAAAKVLLLDGGILMQCGDLAIALRRYGIRVASAYDGDEDEDGDLMVGANVHVQVSTFGDAPRVVVDPFHGDFRYYPRRESIADLAADIRSALNEVPSVIAISSLH